MNDEHENRRSRGAPGRRRRAARRRRSATPDAPLHPVLDTLFELYPHLFGARFLPLKLGVFEEMVAAPSGPAQAGGAKVALGLHTRSTRYLEAVAGGLPRHDLQGQPVEPVAPEHVHHAILELYRPQERHTAGTGGAPARGDAARCRPSKRPAWAATATASGSAPGPTTRCRCWTTR